MHLLPPWYLADETEASVRLVVDWLADLADEWICFHNRPFTYFDSQRVQHDAESDVILLHQSHGVVGIEVKGGFPIVRDGIWYPDDDYPKSPMVQAKRAKYALVERKRKVAPEWLPYACLVALPDVRSRDIPAAGFGPEVPREVILSGDDMRSDPQSVLRNRLGAWWGGWERRSADERARVAGVVRDLLAPTTSVTVLSELSRSSAHALERRTLTLVDEQVTALEALSRNRKTATLGPAGTGKTLIAVERANRLSDAGARVLFFTPNVRQGSRIRREFDVSKRLAHRRQLLPTSGGARSDDTFAPGWIWVPSPTPRSGVGLLEDLDEFVRTMLVEAERGVEVDALIVDEAQDVPPDGLAALECMLKTDGFEHLFGDPYQARSQWTPTEAHEIWLTAVCRNTRPIVNLVDGLMPQLRIARGRDIAGPPVEVIPVSGPPTALAEAAADVFYLLASAGFDRQTIDVVISATADVAVEIDHELRRLARLREPVLPAPNHLEQYKGLDNQVVILVVHSLHDSGDMERQLYIGASRACVVLKIVASPVAAAVLTRAGLESEFH